VSWTGTDAGSGVASYALQFSTDGGGYSTISNALTTTSTNVTLPAGHAYRFRVRATDNLGYTSAYKLGKTVHLDLFQENNGALAYSNGWTRIAHAGSSGGFVKEATVAGKKVTFTYSGVQVGFVTVTSSSNGSATIAVDGGASATVDTHAGGAVGKVRYVKPTPAGAHSLVLTVSGTAGHPKVDVDAFVVLS